jgi:hypothetical protein
MVTTYNDSNTTYNEADTLYNGIVLGINATLLVNEQDVTEFLADRSLSVRVGSHGNSLGTLDAVLNDPTTVPATEDEVRLYIGNTSRYLGTCRLVEAEEYRGGHLFVKIAAQDSGPDGSLPSAGAFGLSDNPDGSTTHGYQSLKKQTRTTEGGSAKTTLEAVVGEHGLWVNENIEVTSANHGLSAVEYTIQELTLNWRNADAPRYSFKLGDPIVSLSQMVADGDLIGDGSITTTKISDDAITTPKIAANAVTATEIAASAITADKISAGAISADKIAAGAISADKIAADAITADKISAGAIGTTELSASAVIKNVTNDGAEVVIDGSGIAVTSGAITVTNASATVIIDGTSNMFKILTTGTLNVAISTDGSGSNTSTLAGFGAFATTPAHLSVVTSNLSGNDERYIGSFAIVEPTTGTIVNRWFMSLYLDGSAQVVAKIGGHGGFAATYTGRYYVLKEAAI